MQKIEIGQQVKMAIFENQIFRVTEVQIDGSYSVETQLSGQQVLSYNNVSREMLSLCAANT